MKVFGLYINVSKPILYVLLTLCILIFIFGIYKRLWPCAVNWKKNKPSFRPSFLDLMRKAYEKESLFRDRLFRKPLDGICHTFIFWSFICILISSLLVEFNILDKTFFILRDLAGLTFIAGLLIALSRRFANKKNESNSNLRVSLIIVSLLIIVISGYLIEGLGISIIKTEGLPWSPVGWFMGSLFIGLDQKSLMITHQFISWLFVILSLFIIAIIPYSHLFHVITAPLAIWNKSASTGGTLPVPDNDWGRKVTGVSTLHDLNCKEVFDIWGCVECGRCEEVCPSFSIGRPLSPRKFIFTLRKNFTKSQPYKVINFDPDLIWSCVTCAACMNECPVMIEHIPLLVDLRRSLVEKGHIPSNVTGALESISSWNNPWKKPPAHRWNWIEELGVPVADASGNLDLIYWVGCTACYDPLAQIAAKTFINLLKKAGCNFSVLGNKEICCGDMARRIGEEGLFRQLVNKNLDVFNYFNPKSIVTTCPHCYHIFKSEYPEINKKWEVIHYTTFLAKLIRNGKLSPVRELSSTITFHDPCYLGRYENEYESPREVLMGLPGVKLIEMEYNREKSYCCGGGGGQMWLDVRGKERINNVRISHAKKAGVESVITACPYCHIMLNSSASANISFPKITVYDFAQFLSERV